MIYFIKDWRECSQSIVSLSLQKDRFYYLQARAWHIKGYLGGTHSYSAMWSKEHNDFLVIELTTPETLSYQKCSLIVNAGSDAKVKTNHYPSISNRPFNAQWFGSNPYIVDSSPAIEYSRVIDAIEQYPITEFRILDQNCNTFTSYLHWKLQLRVHRPIRSIGYKNKLWWEKNYGT